MTEVACLSNGVMDGTVVVLGMTWGDRLILNCENSAYVLDLVVLVECETVSRPLGYRGVCTILIFLFLVLGLNFGLGLRLVVFALDVADFCLSLVVS